MIKSINYNQTDILKDILQLYIPEGKFSADVTYSKGVFYKDIPQPELKFDLIPQYEEVIKADCRQLPLEDNCLKSIMYDPPFLATSGKSLTDESDISGNLIAKRFGTYKNEKELHTFYVDSLTELHRVLDNNGILVVKCQDKVSSGKQYLSHVFLINKAIQIGFYPIDLFVLLAKSRIYAAWQVKNQQHSRKFHSYFIVFKKCEKIIEYT